jgi:transcriptional regulator with XRE-family HTH domain
MTTSYKHRKKLATTHFGKNMRIVRKLKNMTLKELEEPSLKCHALSDLENGYRDPRPNERKIIAEKLGVSEMSLEKCETIVIRESLSSHLADQHPGQEPTTPRLPDNDDLLVTFTT